MNLLQLTGLAMFTSVRPERDRRYRSGRPRPSLNSVAVGLVALSIALGGMAGASSARAQTTSFGYAYDALGRLVSATVNGAKIRRTDYAYDPADNRTTRTTNGAGFDFYVVPLGGGRLLIKP